MNYAEQKVAILGYGLEGRDVEKFLMSKGAEITVFDKKEKLPGSKTVPTGRWKTGKDYLKGGLDDFDLIVRSPGVYRYLPKIVEAEKKKAVVTSAAKLFFENCPGKIIGVTGTKGKGTTSSLIYEILKKDGRDVYLAGNIGKPYLELLPKLNKKSWVVMEMSSFQLIDMDISPYIAVVLNITADHLDWHKNINEYLEAKKNILKFQKQDDFAVINFNYRVSKDFAKATKAKIVPFSKEILEQKFKENILLRGEHNLENIAAAVSVAKTLKINEEKIINTLKNFKGLEHRLEFVDTVDGRTFYNDSFATGPTATIAAMSSFTEPETLILGGSDKKLDYKSFIKRIARTRNVKNIIVIGQIRKMLIDYLKGSTFQGRVFDLGMSPMEKIVTKAYGVTNPGEVIILSPAAASFDMFTDYKDRGNQFKSAVRRLKK